MGARGRKRRPWYRRYVEEGLLREIDEPWTLIQWQTAMGKETFARKLQEKLSARRSARRETTALRQGARARDPISILQAVARHYKVSVAKLRERRGYGLEARNVAIWLVWENCGMSQQEVGEFFGGLHYSAVAQRLRRLTPRDRKSAADLLA